MKTQLFATLAFVAVTGLSACSQQQEEPAPMPVMPEPTYNKYGEVVHGDHTHATVHEWHEHHHSTLTGSPNTF